MKILDNSDTINKKHRKTILIVEDYEQMNTLLKNTLADTYHIICAHNGIEALQILESHPGPDLIISDVSMAEMDGYEFFDIISGIEQLKNIPFIFLSARPVEKERIQGLSRGMVDFIIKPFSITVLRAKIDNMLQ